MKKYSVKQLSDAAGISIRTLHYYDQIGLLKPGYRSDSGYRYYGEREMLMLQQILLYRELEFKLEDIVEIIHNERFDLVQALQDHKSALYARKKRIDRLISTLNKTIKSQTKMKNLNMRPEELYDGLSENEIQAYRNEAREKYGDEEVDRSEKYLMNLGKNAVQKLKMEQKELFQNLKENMTESADSDKVQDLVGQLYNNMRAFWGTSALPDPQYEQFVGLAKMYESDDRFVLAGEKHDPSLAVFISEAVKHFVAERS